MKLTNLDLEFVQFHDGDWNVAVKIGAHFKELLFPVRTSVSFSKKEIVQESSMFLQKVFGKAILENRPYFEECPSIEFCPRLVHITNQENNRTYHSAYLTSKDLKYAGLLLIKTDLEEEMLDEVWKLLDLVYHEDVVKDLMKVFKNELSS